MTTWAMLRPQALGRRRSEATARRAATQQPDVQGFESHRRTLATIQRRMELAEREFGRLRPEEREARRELIRRMTALHELAQEQRQWLDSHCPGWA